MVVVGLPEPGDALPVVSDGALWLAPLQLAASTDGDRAGTRSRLRAATIAIATAVNCVGAFRIPIDKLKVEAAFTRVVGHIDAIDRYFRTTTPWSSRPVQLLRRGMYLGCV